MLRVIEVQGCYVNCPCLYNEEISEQHAVTRPRAQGSLRLPLSSVTEVVCGLCSLASLPPVADHSCMRPDLSWFSRTALSVSFVTHTHCFSLIFPIPLIPNPSYLHLAHPPYILAHLLKKPFQPLTPPPQRPLCFRRARCLSQHEHPQMWETSETGTVSKSGKCCLSSSSPRHISRAVQKASPVITAAGVPASRFAE